ncbi:MAG: phenylalanine--tRNA ligase subunit alpha [Nocardiopsaceae bacterium]|jgi:phenylalanyl-tRNA synthetase alpha chain|nr:phenylalanine--tRNA ligase subunit alpha [Nocardiopsaceae bacterium]
MSAPNKDYDPVRAAVLAPAEIERMTAEGLAAIASAATFEELKAAEVAHRGRQAPLTLASAAIKGLPPEAKSEAGRRVAIARKAFDQAIADRRADLEAERDQRVLLEETADVTLPFDRDPAGARHPVPALADRLSDVFIGMGYEIAEGPEVEAEWYNFDALNFPPDHPAREMQDTFFVADPGGSPRSGMVLRTHTSPVQIRAMLNRPLPVYVVSPGKCFRSDALDATHSPVFHQIEGLAVDEGLTMADLRGAITAFVEAMFGEGLRTRLRPDYFPFTEPSADVSMECHVCRGESTKPGAPPCRVCKSQGWIEIAGCGMVNPRVLIACGIDPDRYSGFAFGLGIERSLMIRNGLSDIRDAIEGDVRFSSAFGAESSC